MHAHIQARIKAMQRGDVPEGWEIRTLKEVCSKIMDGTHFSPKSKIGNFPYLTSKNIRMGYLDLSDITYISEKEHEAIYNKCPVKMNDILLTKDGASTGNCAINPLNYPFSLLSSVAVLRGNPAKIFNSFLFQFLVSPVGQKTIKDSIAGQAITRITLKNIERCKIPLPPLQEQRKIAEILSAWDDAIRLQQELIARKQEQKRGLMQLLLTGKKRLNGFNDDWIVMKLGNVANIIMGQSPDSKDYNNYGEGKYLIQGNADIKNRKSSPRIWTKTITKECEVGDILMTVRAPVGAIAVSLHNACIGRGICSIKAKKIEHSFLFQLLLSFEKRWLSLEQGSTFTAVNSKDIKNLKVRIPNQKAEQQQIADILSTADREIELLEAELTQFQEQKKGLMQLLLTGAIRTQEGT